jgi:thiamine pyrophosphate-dependent acetolactate synthase large subunit-like protein
LRQDQARKAVNSAWSISIGPSIAREAFYVARAERKPVVLSVPLDLQAEEFPYLPDYMPSTDLLPRAHLLRPTPRSSTKSWP